MKVPSYGSLKMAAKTQSLDVTIRNARGVEGEVQVIRYGAGLEMWISVNQAGNTMKRWGLRYTDAAGKRQKERLTGNIFPAFVDVDINAITMVHIDKVLTVVIERGARETAHGGKAAVPDAIPSPSSLATAPRYDERRIYGHSLNL